MPFKDKESKQTWREQHPEKIREQKVGKVCVTCGEDNIDKVDPSTKAFKFTSGNHNRKALLAEIAKCVVMCHSCHSRYHFTHRE